MADFHGAKAAILLGDRIVTVLRDDIPHIDWPGWWDLPGGGREGEESPEDTVLREIREEVGLVIGREALGWRRSFPSATLAVATSWFFVIHLSPLREAEIVLGDEGEAWRLVSIGDFLANDKAIPFLQDRLRVWLTEAGGTGGPE
jgi:8-oxo-dGTP diphosphatase